MRSDWIIPLCTGGERLKGRGRKKAHPTQKPESLPLARPGWPQPISGDVVLDPFSGSRHTSCGSPAPGADFVGIERDPEYVRPVARKRIMAINAD